MKYMTQKNILIAVGVIVAITLIVWGVQNSPASQQQSADTQITETATTTEETATTTNEDNEEVTSEQESSVTQNTTSPQANTTPPTQNSNVQVRVETQQKVELGPRKAATVSPRAALDYFVEAIQAGDIERAVSYFTESVRDGYHTTFEEYAARGQQHPVVTAYLTGTVGEVELIQPEHGIYEIRVTPKGSELGYTLNFFFENGEFRIWEL